MTTGRLIPLLILIVMVGLPILLIVIQVRRNRQVGWPGVLKYSDRARLRSKEGTYRGRYFVLFNGIGGYWMSGTPSLRLPSVRMVRALKVDYRYGLSRFAERIGFATIIPSGDEAFDRSVLVVSDRDEGERLLRKPEVRRAFTQLLEFGHFKLGWYGLKFHICKLPAKVGGDGIPTVLLDRLIAVAELLEAGGFATRGGREP
jgi:hypothetical protein